MNTSIFGKLAFPGRPHPNSVAKTPKGANFLLPLKYAMPALKAAMRAWHI
jgi:hypothetical protein